MKKIHLIVAGAVIFLIVILIILSALSRDNKQISTLPDISPPPDSAKQDTIRSGSDSDSDSNESSIKLISSDPKDLSQDVPLDQVLTFQFNKTITTDDLRIAIFPDTKVTWKPDGDRVTVEARTTLQPGTPYFVKITYTNFEGYFDAIEFTTTGETPADFRIPSDYTTDEIQQITAEQRENNPEMFLYNQSPYQTDSFLFEASIESINPEIYQFILRGKTDEEQAKKEFTAWALSIGLTEQNMRQIKITYTEQSPQEKALGNLIRKLPHKGKTFLLDHDGIFFLLTLPRTNQKEALDELDQFLKDNDVEERLWLGEIKVNVQQ